MSSNAIAGPALGLRLRMVVVALAGLALAAVALLQAAPANANVPFQTITATHPIRKIFLGNDLSCQVQLSVDNDFDFYPPDTAPGDCGTFLYNGTLYGPNFGSHDRSAFGLGGGSDTPYTGTTQSGVSGDGSTANPFKVTTTGTAGGNTVTETDSYVSGQNTYHSQIQVGGSGTVTIYRAGDCYLAGSDIGYGAADSGSVFCTQNANNSPPGRFIGFIPRTAGSLLYENSFDSVWQQVSTRGNSGFNNTADTNTLQDNGAGLSYTVTAPATVDIDNAFQAIDPFGNATGVTVGRGGVHLCRDFSCAQFQLHCNLPTSSQVPCDPLVTLIINLINGQIHGKTAKLLARQTGIASGQANIAPGQTGAVTLPTTKQGKQALKKRAKRAKKLARKARAAKKAGNTKKAKKLKKKAKRLRRIKAHLGVNNDRNGATANLKVTIKLP